MVTYGHEVSCDYPGCERPRVHSGVFSEVSLCATHKRQWSRTQTLRAAQIRERLSPKEKLLECAHALADCDSADDVAYRKAERALIRAAYDVSHPRRYGGRKQRVPRATVLDLVAAYGHKVVAERLGVTLQSVYRAVTEAAGPRADVGLTRAQNRKSNRNPRPAE